MNIAFRLVAVFVLLIITGCATHKQTPVAITNDFWASDTKKIGVVMEDLPQVNTFFPGAGCLLCLATAEAAHSSLSKHVKTFSADELLELKNTIVQHLNNRGFDAIAIDNTINIAKLPKFSSKTPNTTRKDFSSYKDKYAIDRLLVIDINTLGIVRNYSSYVPTSDPQANFAAIGFIVNLNDNTLSWHKTIDLYQSSEGEWDEAPNFPGLTNAYYQVLEQGRDSFIEPFLLADKQ